MVKLEKISQRLAFFEWDDRQKRIAHQGEVLSRLRPSMAVIVFEPTASVAFVVVFVFYRPVGADGPGGSNSLIGIDTGKKNPSRAFFFAFGVVFLTPMTNDFDR